MGGKDLEIMGGKDLETMGGGLPLLKPIEEVVI